MARRRASTQLGIADTLSNGGFKLCMGYRLLSGIAVRDESALNGLTNRMKVLILVWMASDRSYAVR